MLQSMTGFGSGEATLDGWRVEATIRTLNHRYLAVRVRSMSERPWLQSQIEDLVRSSFRRGDVNVWLVMEQDTTTISPSRFDRGLAHAVYAELKAVSGELGIPGLPSLEDVIRVGGLQPPQQSEEALWPAVRTALERAIEGVVSSRTCEGGVLGEELQRLLAGLEDATTSVRERLPSILDDLRAKLLTRIEGLEQSLAPDRVEAEIVVYADRYDVQEELVRLQSHIERARALLDGSAPVGKELDFLSQELLREVNTIGSKVRDSDVAQTVVDMKVITEQLKEQIQNVE